jgi:hypothetical protein
MPEWAAISGKEGRGGVQAEAAAGWEPAAMDAGPVGPIITAMAATVAEKIVWAAADDDHQSGKMWTLFTFLVFVFTFFYLLCSGVFLHW